jgi:hypothetical protein
MIRYFRANRWSAQQYMNRGVSPHAYVCLNVPMEQMSEAG